MTVTANPTVFTDIDPTGLDPDMLIAESLRLVGEADRAHAASLKPGLPTFRPNGSHAAPVLNQDQADSYAHHTRQQANTLALLALAKS